MKGNTAKIWSPILVVWIWLSSIQCHAINSDLQVKAPNYPKVTYNARDADPEAYGAMIRRLRNLLVSGDYIRGIPVLRETVRDEERYILLEITESRGQTVTFAIDIFNTYVIGYRVGNMRYFFEEASRNVSDFLFTDVREASQRRSSNYNSLEARARQRRNTIPLGLRTLDAAITTLVSQPEDPRSIIIVLQVIAEAARYWAIETRVRRAASGQFTPDTYMLDLQNNWGALSAQIQNSDFLAFETPITIGDRIADNVNSYVISGLFLMLFICNPSSSSSSFISHLEFIKPPSMFKDNICRHSVDPRARIRGRNGLCADVEGFVYRDNTPIVLSACRTNDAKNQLWTLTKDGRIISLEKCLAATGTTSGSSVVIHECDTIDESRIRWKMFYSGTLVNVHSGLVLTAPSGTDGSKLTVETDSFSSFQAWKTGSNFSVVDVYIRGDNDQCIYYNGGKGVYSEPCSRGTTRQEWRLYPDSTIRPKSWLDGCMEIASFTGSSIYVQAGSCSGYGDYHRWFFSHDGSIMNWRSQLVIDASRTYPGYLYAMKPNGGNNQIWMLNFI